jgi:hypothetical protein
MGKIQTFTDAELFRHIEQALSRHGYCLAPAIDDVKLSQLAASLGPASIDPRNPYALRNIQPQDFPSAAANTLSSRYGLGSFPFHTEAAHWRIPPTLLLLHCVCPGSGSRPTLLTDIDGWQLEEETRHLLCEGVWRARHVHPFLCRLGSSVGGNLRLRYDPACMYPRSPTACQAAKRIEAILDRVDPLEFLWRKGDLLIIDNRRVLHGRGSATRPDRDRIIARMLIGGHYDGVGPGSALAKSQSLL